MPSNYGANGKAIASLVLSIFSVLCCCTWYLALMLGVVSIVLGILALRGENMRQHDMAIAGIVVGSTGTMLSIITAILYIVINHARMVA